MDIEEFHNMVTNDKSKGKVEEDSDLPRDFTVENVATGETINIENVQTVSEIEKIWIHIPNTILMIR